MFSSGHMPSLDRAEIGARILGLAVSNGGGKILNYLRSGKRLPLDVATAMCEGGLGALLPITMMMSKLIEEAPDDSTQLVIGPAGVRFFEIAEELAAAVAPENKPWDEALSFRPRG